jgi:hypothetical protein
MGAGIARQCSGNRCLARWTVWIPLSRRPRRSRSSELEEDPAHERHPSFVPHRRSWEIIGRMPTTAKTIRIIEIAELLGVTHQRPSLMSREPGFPRPIGGKARAGCGTGVRSRRGRGHGGRQSCGARPGTRDRISETPYSIATIASTMIGTFSGEGPCPGAERACRPASPQSSTMRSLKPLTTAVFCPKPGAQWT